MEVQKFKELVMAPALESIGVHLLDTADKVEPHEESSAEYLRIAAGYVMIAHQKMRGEKNA
tara:strand:- start:448 stop:630 length:183 start_codon:yes stop_codon:yes gene_type:complete